MYGVVEGFFRMFTNNSDQRWVQFFCRVVFFFLCDDTLVGMSDFENLIFRLRILLQ